MRLDQALPSHLALLSSSLTIKTNYHFTQLILQPQDSLTSAECYLSLPFTMAPPTDVTPEANGAVDESPVSPVERRNSLEKHLQLRPDVQELKNRHILLETPAAPCVVPTYYYIQILYTTCGDGLCTESSTYGAC